MAYKTAACCVCGSSIAKDWRIHPENKCVFFLCQAACAEVYRLNPLVYEDAVSLPYNQWIGRNSSRAWTLEELKLRERLI